MILITPLRLITRQLLHLGLTDADTFMINAFYLLRPIIRSRLFEPISNAATGQVVRGQLDQHPITGENPDEVHPDLSRYMGQHFVVIR